MDRRFGLLFAAVVMFGFIAIAGAGATVTADNNDLVYECAAEPPSDFAPPEDGNETIGWFDGHWYNQPLDIDASDGINQDELANLSARTAARFEALRCLSLNEMPPVDIITRDEFINETDDHFETVAERERQFDNTQFETMLTISSEEDSIEVRQADRAVTVGGYYNFVEERIAVITDDPENMLIDEEILAHELGHAIQDQHFDLETYERPTRDIDNAKLGVIEGDVHLIEMEYLERCEQERWDEPCIVQDREPGAGAGEPPNWGLYFMQFQPYSDGPNFVEHIYETEGGWDGVNDLYEEMPQHSQQVISPDRYGEGSVAELDVESDPSGDWKRLTTPSGPNYNELGEAGMASMFIGQSYESFVAGAGDDAILRQEEFLNIENPTTGELDPFNPINYDVWPTDGWAGDRLYVYTDDANRTGSLWKTSWEDREQRDEFITAYETLASDRGGERVDDYGHTWEFGGGSDYDMAMTLYPDGDSVWIVTAPTVDDLTEINGNIELLEEDDRGTDGNGVVDDNGVGTGDDGNGVPTNGNGDDEPPGDDTDDVIPGFGPLGAVAAVFALILWRLRAGPSGR